MFKPAHLFKERQPVCVHREIQECSTMDADFFKIQIQTTPDYAHQMSFSFAKANIGPQSIIPSLTQDNPGNQSPSCQPTSVFISQSVILWYPVKRRKCALPGSGRLLWQCCVCHCTEAGRLPGFVPVCRLHRRKVELPWEKALPWEKSWGQNCSNWMQLTEVDQVHHEKSETHTLVTCHAG